MTLSVAIVGLGSRGLGVLERLVALADRPVRVEVIDPSCSGAGVHAVDQPDYLLLNTTAAQVSMFPSAATVGPSAVAGPSLFDWVTARGLRVAADGFTVGPEGREILPTDFLPRRLLGEYLGWFLDRLLERAPGHVRVTLHRTTAVDLRDAEPDLVLDLADGSSVRVAAAYLTTGYPAPPPAAGADRVIPAPYPLPAAVAGVRPGEVVAVGGFGLSAMDVVSALTVGRGGRWVDGVYRPSGLEPVILLHSRTGVPLRARPQVVRFGPAYEPRVFTEAGIDAVRAAADGPLDFERDLLPLVLAEMRVAYRLATGVTFPDRADVLAVLDELDAEHGVFDARALFDGAATVDLASAAAYQEWLAGVLRADLAEGLLGFTGSPVKAALDVLRALRDTFRYAVDFGGLTPESADEFARTTVPALNRAVVGPQYERHAELLALLAAGVVAAPFGPSPAVAREDGRWRVSSTRLAAPYSRLVDRLVVAYVEPPGVGTTTDPLLAALHRAGRLRRHRPDSRHVHGVDVDRDQHPIGAGGRADLRLVVLGPLCEGTTFYNNLVPSPGIWSRPVHDAHRTVQALLARTGGGPPPGGGGPPPGAAPGG